MQLPKFYGCYTAIVTPLIGGQVDNESLHNLIKFQIKKGIHGIVACGTTGEAPTLSHEEQIAVIKFVVKTVDGRVPVIAGAGANSTREAIALTKDAEKAGADAILSVVPYYNKPSQYGIYQHFSAISKETNLPLFLYNVPSRTVSDMLPETVSELSKIPNIIGIKEAKGDLGRITDLVRICPEDFIVLSGDDFTAASTIFMGGKGVISVTSNVNPVAMANMIECAIEMDVETTRLLHNKIYPLMQAMFCYPSPAPAKKALEMMGVIESSEVRLPMTPVDEASLRTLKKAMSQAGIIFGPKINPVE